MHGHIINIEAGSSEKKKPDIFDKDKMKPKTVMSVLSPVANPAMIYHAEKSQALDRRH